MYKYLFALTLLTGSFASYAGAYEDASAIDNSNRSAIGDSYSDRYYEDSSTTKSSATSRNEELDQPAASASASSMDTTTTGMMPDMSKEGRITQKWHAGVTSGISNPKTDAVDSSPSFGVDVGYQPMEHVGAGLEAFTEKQDDIRRFQRTTGLLKATFHLGGDTPVLNTAYIGGGIGPVFISNRVRWAGAPMVGFDIPLSNKSNDFLSLGLNAKYVFTTDQGDTPNELASALALKYWF